MIGKTSAGTSAKEQKTVTAGTGQTVVTPSNGKLLSKVTINPTPSQTKTATPKQTQQTIKPDSGKLLSKVTVKAMPEILAEEWSSKHKAILDGGTEAISYYSLTIKDIIYANGYWLGIANDANGNLCRLYTTSLTGAWTVAYVAQGNNYPAVALACDGTYTWIVCAPDAVGRRNLLRIAFSDFISSSGTQFNISYYTLNDFARINDITYYSNRLWLVGQNASGAAVTAMNTSDIGTSLKAYIHGSFTKPITKCCMYNTYPIAISSDGYYTYKSSITDSSIRGEFTIASGFTSQIVEQMGDYLCVAGTKDDGLYLYYANGTPGSLSWSYIKISDSALTPVGMGYANGLYVLVYLTADGKTKYWCSTDLGRKGISGIDSKNSSFTASAACANGDKALLVAGKSGSYIGKYPFTIS